MSTDLIRARSGNPCLSPPFPSPQVSRAMLQAYEDTRNPHPDVGPPTEYTAAVQAEARRALEVIAPFAVPVTESTLREWLMPIPSAVRNEKAPEAIVAWLTGVAMAVGHLEVGAFTAETQREALQTFRFFPSAADVYEVVAGPAVKIRERIRVLRIIASGGGA